MSDLSERGSAAVSDEELVAMTLRGRQDRYAVLVNRYRRKLAAHVMRIVRNREDALEITQDAFLKAYQNLSRYDPKYRFSTWIYAIAGNAAIDHVRRKKLPTTSLDEPMELEDSRLRREPKGDARTADDLFEARELLEAVERAIAQLPPEYRQLLLLRHPAGKSYEEIAKMTKLPLGTVKNRIFRARARLRDILGDALPAGY